MSTHNISLYKEVNKRYTDCHLKTTKFLDCALIGVCVVIRSNTVYCFCGGIRKILCGYTLLSEFILIFTFLWAYLAEDRLVIFFLFFPENRIRHFMLDALSDWRPGGRGFNPSRGRQHSFVEIDHEIFSTVILSLPLIQEGLSCQFLAKEHAQYWLTA